VRATQSIAMRDDVRTIVDLSPPVKHNLHARCTLDATFRNRRSVALCRSPPSPTILHVARQRVADRLAVTQK
jgi:hypothetical protein